ncbi:pilus assembly protein TadG-related protein [Streptomonospora salina]|uniref:Putative Flp pilus-assembly TadG-like N-terminal domain-containing protein n=1 Tax=Streptomonospora salina TaxID=104205 RepID=A0A841E0M9_9ACTN|nr:pilus assembly protein TadG-related protein [Streptomonospora salina]MBB5997307.1 hypothetical protein [Streptomonospora salina]
MRRVTGKAHCDRGQANLFLLIGLTLSLVAIMLLFVRVGNANELRTEAQAAADAAAFAAAGIARDSVAERISNNELPYSRLYDPGRGRSAAEHYADQNGAVLDSIRASDDSQGNLGNIVRVEVHSARCQEELKGDRSRAWTDIQCDEPDPDSNHTGNAAAIVKVTIPDCQYEFGGIEIAGLSCDGISVESFAHAQQLIDVALVEEEGQYIYNPPGF